jgi:hypothetical protein
VRSWSGASAKRVQELAHQVAVTAILGAAEAAGDLRLARSGGARRLGAPLFAAGPR